MRGLRLHRRMTIGAAVASLALSALVGTAATAQEAPETAAAENAPDTPVRRAHGPSEVTGPEASVNAMRSGKLSCGQVITRSTTLTADVGPCPGSGIIIGADKITLNLNGHTISGTPGPGDGNTAGVRLPMRSGVTVTGQPGDSGRKGTITGFDAGVLVNRGSGNTVQNLTVRDNIGPASRDAFLGDGIAVMNSANNTIRRNTVDHNGIYDGIGVLGEQSHANTIRDNTVINGIALVDLSGPAGNGTGVGIVVDAYLDPLPPRAPGPLIRGNQVLDNVVRANDGPGISNVMTQDGRVAGNTVEDNGHVSLPGNGIGFQLGLFPQSTEGRMVVENNVIRRNGGTGIYSTEDKNTLRGNIVEENGWQPPRNWDPHGGIYMQVTPVGGGLIEGNTVRHNGGSGLGIMVESVDRDNGGVSGLSNNNRIHNNSSTDHSTVGIMLVLTGGTGNEVVSNYAVNNPGFADLVDGGGLFFGAYEGCGANLWFDNTYEVGMPECTGNGGTQVSVP